MVGLGVNISYIVNITSREIPEGEDIGQAEVVVVGLGVQVVIVPCYIVNIVL